MASGRPSFLRATRGERKGKLCKLNGKKGGEFDAGRGKRTTAKVLLYFELPCQGSGNSDWSPIAICQSVNNKTSQSQRSPIFTAAFCSTWRTDTVGELHSSFRMEAEVFNEAYCFCGTWTIFSVKICPLFTP